MSGSLRVLFVASEYAPLVKTGGLADVCASLSAALHHVGVDVRVMIPAYASISRSQMTSVAKILPAKHFPPAEIFTLDTIGLAPVMLLDCPALYGRNGGPYQNADGKDWEDNALRFGQLCRVAAAVACDDVIANWRPDIIHCHDWHTGLIPAYLNFRGSAVATIFTVHNLAFQGIFPADEVSKLELPQHGFAPDGFEFFGKLSFMKSGLQYANAITTVSPTYAAEIQTESLGMGLHGVLASRKTALTGIINGIDTDEWNPEKDPHIPRPYSASTLDRKMENKRALQSRAALPHADLPLIGMVTRLTEQKGIDWVIEIIPALADMPLQLVILGRGEAGYERELQRLAEKYPSRLSVKLDFDESLAHLIEAGADMFLMPSRFEPCGMNQMYSQRYGTVPIVRATGGLSDTVIDHTKANGTGFVFTEPDASAVLGAVHRAIAVYADNRQWRTLQLNGMATDFSWLNSAKKYVDVYQDALRSAKKRHHASQKTE